eukprot:6666349-Alexandrium_andersonii.AAC.1
MVPTWHQSSSQASLTSGKSVSAGLVHSVVMLVTCALCASSSRSSNSSELGDGATRLCQRQLAM